jgi:hypothetical protein
MKYLLLLLIPAMAQATMNAQTASQRVERAKEQDIVETNAKFVASISPVINAAVEMEKCGVDFYTAGIDRKVKEREFDKLKKLGYTVVGDFNDVDIVVSWCKE